MRSPAVKRLMREAQELKDATEDYFAQPLEDNLFEWHFTVRGPADTEFEGGMYHGRIILPPEYPMKPPSIIVLTPNGRFDINKKICLSISGHHPESWRPSWSIRTALLAIIGFMPTSGNGAIGSLDYTADERKILAKKSLDWECSQCGDIKALLPKLSGKPSSTSLEAQDIVKQITMDSEAEKQRAGESESAVTGEAPEPVAPPEQASGDVTQPEVPVKSSMSEEEMKEEALKRSNELRQRFVANRQRIAARIDTVMAAANSASAGETAGTEQPATTTATSTPAINSRYDTSSLLLMVVLSFGIAALLIRRIFFL